jgi:hypothetical protein
LTARLLREKGNEGGRATVDSMHEELNLLLEDLPGEWLDHRIGVRILEVREPVDGVGLDQVGHTVEGAGSIAGPSDVGGIWHAPASALPAEFSDELGVREPFMFVGEDIRLLLCASAIFPEVTAAEESLLGELFQCFLGFLAAQGFGVFLEFGGQ